MSSAFIKADFPRLHSLILLIFFTLNGFAQNSPLIPVNDPALRQKQIRCLYLDHKNRIWCGTDDGIYCYDGYQTIPFRNDKNKKPISDNFINNICADPHANILLFSTNKGVTLINTQSMQSFVAQSAGSKNNFPLNNVHCLVKADSNEYWGLSDNQVFSLTVDNNSQTFGVKKLNVDENVNNEKFQLFSVAANKKDPPQIYMTASDVVLKEINRENLSLTEIGMFRGVNSILYYRGSKLLSCFNGLFRYNESRRQATLLVPGELNLMQVDKGGNMWLVRDRTKLLRYDGDHKVTTVAAFNSEEESKYQLIYSIAADKNNIWLGTAKGLLNLKTPKPCFSAVFHDVPHYLPGERSSRGMLRVNDTSILLCGYHYFFSFNPLTNKITELLPKSEAEALLPYSLCRTGDSIWIATEGKGLKLFSLKKKKLIPAKFSNTETNLFIYKGLLRSATLCGDWIYMAEYGFVGRMNYKTGRVESRGKLHVDNGRSLGNVLQIRAHNDELVFVASDLIIVSDTSLNLKRRIRPETLSPDTRGLITCALPDSNGIWIGTNAKGLFYLNWKSNQIKKFLTGDGLADNTVYSIVGHADKLFIGTKNGLSVLDKASGKISNYFEEDGLVNNEFNGSSFLTVSKEKILMGGIKGVTLIEPQKMNGRKEAPPFFLSKLVMAAPQGGKDTMLLGRLEDLHEIQLPYQNRFLQVFYSLTNYSSFNRFAYTLEGASDQWIELGNQNQITFNSLEPGSYTLRIKAWDERGNALPKEILLKITAMQVFYKTNAFLIFAAFLAVLLATGSFYIYYRVEIRNIQRLADLRLRIASDLHDQVGGLLNKTAIQAELANSRTGKNDQQLDKIALNSRTALNSMRDILWNLDPRNDNTESLVERMKDYVVKMLEDDFIYDLKFNEVGEIELPHEVRQNLNMIFKESVNNIVKHAKGSRVSIFFGADEKHLLLSIHSSESLKSDLVSTGQGLRNIRMRAEAMKADFEFDTSNGVSIKIKLPLNHMKM